MKIKLICLIGFFSSFINAQDLTEILEQEEVKNTKEDVYATFKGTRILNGHSIENRKKGTLDFIISHKFGRVNEGFDQFFGLDQSNIRFAFEYAISDDVTLGVGRSSFEKTYDGFIKYKIVKQSKGMNSFPASISIFASTALKTIKDYDPENKPSFGEKFTHTTQLLIARKITPKLSLQVSPTWVHKNLVKIQQDPHDIFALGMGGRMKLSNRVTLNTEYYYTFNPLQSINTKNSLALGVDIETGGHVFQLMLSNTITMIEKGFITETTGNFFKGDIHFGFNISRSF
ncbi:DUF5777 family beta-barrel protein [Tenacibaculum maritimum]|uniref:DUF5777 family beta-barrel protein n=1 Tax=Tenacibaculum maritimum TaxID=107401 RepID=UPI0010A4C05E|nr:DUF5777 family beta-barrel protein [Tenacibaculum maritimum]QCD63539.1 hypothetical protein B9C57_13800 [Tenacibaculum maritimum]CAA0170596.1 conserved exported hypothetical protein [Tenacibaculum maritimum]CAA0187104.1 conserved exported hypothetical protein [Tenacibaculum maritimum]CAA0202400.1 conserved exported hypothetical protein [Tenacibaculum maritimum]CAA0206982.1 conserved exported hypothetical protein [Tenacibaculum maritimum]